MSESSQAAWIKKARMDKLQQFQCYHAKFSFGVDEPMNTGILTVFDGFGEWAGIAAAKGPSNRANLKL